MSQFLYFFPGQTQTRLPRQLVASTFAVTALRDLLRSDKTWAGDAVVFNPCMVDGPGGQTGVVFAVQPEGGFGEGFTPAYIRDKQKWVKIDQAWLGWDRDNPPTELSLRKPVMVSGYPVKLNDDCLWTAPTIRCLPQGSRITLPQAVRLDDNGQRVVGVKEFYQHWQALVEKLWDYRFDKQQMTAHEVIDAAAELLSLNYRVGPREIDALGLFEMCEPGKEAESNLSDVIVASYDWPLVQELIDTENAKKKSQPEHLSTSAGESDEAK